MYIQLTNVSKKIKSNDILKDINLRMESGKIYGFKGKNGCGKTMLMRAISGLIKVKGTVDINGQIIGKDIMFPPSIGLLIENPSFINNYTAFENLKTLASIRRRIDDNRIRETLTEIGLDPDDKRTFHKFSLGMKQRLGIAAAIMENPDIIILDEPINGLDPQGIAEVRDTIQRLQKERNMTICISSHILEELSKIATDYGIIHNGSLLQELTREELMRRCSERMELTLADPKLAIPVLDAMGFTNYQVTDKEHIHIFERLNESAALNMELAKAGIPVKGLSITSEELETYFLNLTGGASHA